MEERLKEKTSKREGGREQGSKEAASGVPVQKQAFSTDMPFLVLSV